MSSLKADAVCVPIQKMVFEKSGKHKDVNSFEPDRPAQKVRRADGIVYRNDLCYGTTYPNSYFDLWSMDSETPRPTVIYFHGGGFLFGDKIMGDPLGVEMGQDNAFFAEIVKAGFNLVSANYAFAPQYRYPVQVHQVNALVAHLMAHQAEYGLDMDRVVMMGGSAGADLTEIYGLVVSEPSYADDMHIVPAISKAQLKVLVVDESGLSPRNYDTNMSILTAVWIGKDDFKDSEQCRQMDVPRHIKGSYIPSFINSSNMEVWFYDSTKDLKDVLDSCGVPNEFYYCTPDKDQLEHGYLQRFQSNPYAGECFKRMIEFMKKYT